MIEKKADSQQFTKPDEGDFNPTGYDYDSSGLFAMDQKRQQPHAVFTFNLANLPVDPLTGTTASFLELREPGYGFVAYVYATSDVLKVPISGLITVGVQDKQYTPMPIRSGRGYRGPFTRLYLNWAVQANNSVDIIIYKFQQAPYQNPA